MARRRYGGAARVVQPSVPDYARLWAAANAGNRNRYRGYQTRAPRPIPIVVLTPEGGAPAGM